MTTEEKIEVMQGFADGKQIQIKSLMSKSWTDLNYEPSWSWELADYRIKPEPKYRPYESMEEMIDDFKERFDVDNPKYTRPFIWLRGKYTRVDFLITLYAEEMVSLNNGVRHDFKHVFKYFEYLDGTPCGKLVEE